MAFTLPNTLANGQSGDATKVQQNFDALLSALNTSVILKDGSVAMTQPLNLSGDPVSALEAAPKQYVDNAMPLGSVVLYSGTSAPTSQWLLCRGQAVSRSTYAGLFAIMGTAYGVGNGTTTFNLPNMQGTLPVGYNAQSGQPSGITTQFSVSLGERFGSTDAIVVSHAHVFSTTTQIESTGHFHTGTTTGQSNDHFHAIKGSPDGTGSASFELGNTADASNGAYSNLWNTGGISQDHTHNFTSGGVSQNHTHTLAGTTATVGSSAVGANYPPSQSFNFIVKAL